ncbi:MAG TPA: hypothetical protein VFH68_14580 [Polyangia bacterium]|jgi:hypothetical protein|nr:hypothetical protein [Polyangia bacterium]
MAFPRGRCLSSVAVALAVGLASVAGGRVARAGKHDLKLLNLCRPENSVLGAGIQECSWIQSQRDPTSHALTGPVGPDDQGTTNFRSLMSELGVVIAPRLQTPADTLGFSGFQFAAELGMTKINRDRGYWDGVEGVDPANRTAARPDAYLTTVGGFVRKGIWLPLPAFEIGAGALNIVGSSMFSVQGYAKLALQEGFHSWPVPSVAIRVGVSQLVGTDQVDLTVVGVDAVISKAFSIAGTARFEPYLGGNLLFIDARSGVIDATPRCDAFALEHGTAAPSPYCGQAGNSNDSLADFTFRKQDIITRQRYFAGFKLKLSVLFLTAEYDLIPVGRSRDDSQANGARDESGQQQSFSLSTGFDF